MDLFCDFNMSIDYEYYRLGTATKHPVPYIQNFRGILKNLAEFSQFYKKMKNLVFYKKIIFF